MFRKLKWMIEEFKKAYKIKHCKHEWKSSMFQKLTDDTTTTYVCLKCGEYKQF